MNVKHKKYLNRAAAALMAASMVLPTSLAPHSSVILANEVWETAGAPDTVESTLFQPLPAEGLLVTAGFEEDGTGSGSSRIIGSVIPAGAVYDGKSCWEVTAYNHSTGLTDREIEEAIKGQSPASSSVRDLEQDGNVIGDITTETFQVSGQPVTRITEAYLDVDSVDVLKGAVADGQGGWSLSYGEFHQSGSLNPEQIAELEAMFSGVSPVFTETEPVELDGYFGTRTIEHYDLEDGPYIRKTEVYYPVSTARNAVDYELDAEFDRTGTWKADHNGGSRSVTVVPGTAKIESSAIHEVEDKDSVSPSDEVFITKASALLKNNEDSEGKFNADVTLKLNHGLDTDEIRISVIGNGENRLLDADTISMNENLDEINFHVDGISRINPENITLWLHGQPQRITNLSEWTVPFNSGDGAWDLGDMDRFSVFSRKYTWTNHTNANVATEVLDLEANNPVTIGIGMNNPYGESDTTDYSRKDLNYIGRFQGSGTLHTNETRSFLIVADPDLTIERDKDPGHSSMYTFTKDGQKVEKQNGTIAGVLKASGSGVIDFDSAFGHLESYAANQQKQTDLSAWKSESDRQAVKDRLGQIGKASERKTEGNRDFMIDASLLPEVSGMKYWTVDMKHLQSLDSSDQWFRFFNISEDDRIIVNVTGMDASKKEYSIRPNIELNGQRDQWHAANNQVMFNFGDYAGKININMDFYGSILAPCASVHSPVTFNGKLMALNVSGSNEQHTNGNDWDKVSLILDLKLSADAARMVRTVENADRSVEVETTAASYYKAVTPPDEPENPDTPDTPDEPENPDTPDHPDQPDTPDEPENPDTPDNPDEPGTPDKPAQPDTPEEPEKPVTPPSKPEEPTVPEKPVTPDQPETPEKPESPEQPEKPETPEKPTIPETPEKPEQPEKETPAKPETKKPVQPSSVKSPNTAASTMAELWTSLAGLSALGTVLSGWKKKKSR